MVIFQRCAALKVFKRNISCMFCLFFTVHHLNFGQQLLLSSLFAKISVLTKLLSADLPAAVRDFVYRLLGKFCVAG